MFLQHIDRFPVKPADIDYLFLTHAHIDHIGRIPDIIDAGFKGEIICTHATKALLIPMLHDAMSFSGRTDRQTDKMESKIDDLSWGFELYELDRIKTKVPVFIDSPLGLKITKIYSTLEKFWDKEAKILKSKGDHPIDFKNLYAVQTYRDHILTKHFF